MSISRHYGSEIGSLPAAFSLLAYSLNTKTIPGVCYAKSNDFLCTIGHCLKTDVIKIDMCRQIVHIGPLSLTNQNKAGPMIWRTKKHMIVCHIKFGLTNRLSLSLAIKQFTIKRSHQLAG